MKLLNKSFVIICAVMFLVGFSFYLITPVLPLLLEESFAASKSQIGLTMGSFAVGALIARPLAGLLLDTINRKTVGLICLFGFLLITLAYYVIGSTTTVMVVRSVNGLFWGLIATLMYTIAADIIPEDRRGAGFGIFMSMVITSMSLAPIVGMNLYESNIDGFKKIVLVASVIIIASIFLLSLIKLPKIELDRSRHNLLNFVSGFFNKKVMLIAVIGLTVSFVFSGIVSFILLYAKMHAFDNPSLFFTIYALSTIIVRPAQGVLFDRYGQSMLLIISSITSVIAYIILGIAPTYFTFCFAASLLGMSVGILFAAPQAMAMNLIEAKDRGRANSTLSLASDIGMLSGSYTLGMLSQYWGYDNMYLMCAVIYFCLLLYIMSVVNPFYSMYKKCV